MIKESDLTATILAGGESSRFGFPKQIASYHERSLLENAICIANDISPKVSVIFGNDIYLCNEKIDIYQDFIQNIGPMGGIYTALHCAATPYIAIMPCDMPFLDPKIFHILRKYESGEFPVVALSQGKIEPLVSIWSKKLIPLLNDFIEKNKYSLKYLLNKITNSQIEISEQLSTYTPEIFLNINYRHDFDRYAEILKKKYS
jgi:molybdopterin-guanine dinucleotide biosynthesis protein A